MSSARDAEGRLAAASASAPPDLIGPISQAMLNSTLASTQWTRFIHAPVRPDLLDDWQAMALHRQSSPGMSVALLLHMRTAQSDWPFGGTVRSLAQLTDRDVAERGIPSAAPDTLFHMTTQPWVRWNPRTAASRFDLGPSETSAAVVESHDRASRLRALADWSTAVADLDWDHLDSIDQHAWGQITDA